MAKRKFVYNAEEKFTQPADGVVLVALGGYDERSQTLAQPGGRSSFLAPEKARERPSPPSVGRVKRRRRG
jgi:hypothetical protein